MYCIRPADIIQRNTKVNQRHKTAARPGLCRDNEVAAISVHMHVSVHLPCCVYAGCSLELQCFEVKTEADSSDITDYDDMPSTGMFVFIDGQFPCTAFVFKFHVSVVFPCTSQTLVCVAVSDNTLSELRHSHAV